MDEGSRIYGDAWFDFLGSSRTVLGAEAGSNVFDFDGTLEAQLAQFKAVHGRLPTHEEFKPVTEPLEKYFDVGQISARVFESAVMRTPMIMFRGRYSDAIEPDVHYLALEKDFSNVEDILARLNNLEVLQGYADRAYRQLVQSGKYGYRTLAKLLEDTIEQEYPRYVDADYVAYRRDTGAARKGLGSPQSREDARWQALGEVPTALPLGSDDFRHHGMSLARLRLLRSAKYGSPLWAILRKGWHMLPMSMRQAIIRIARL
jgi:hypothetical protein